MVRWVSIAFVAAFCAAVPAGAGPVVYVANDGSDANDGFSPASPVKTFARAAELSQGEVRLHRGDAWSSEGFGSMAASDVVVGAYGEGVRPLIKHDGDGSIHMWRTSRVGNVKIEGLEFVGTGNNRAFLGRLGAHDITLEDNVFRKFRTALLFEDENSATVTDVTVRGNRFIDADGVFASGTENLVIESNAFDGGWSFGHGPDDGPGLDGHNVYITPANVGTVVRNNVSVRSQHIGLRVLSQTSEVTGNLAAFNALGIEVGIPRGLEATDEPVESVVKGNVVTEPVEKPEGSRGWGLGVGDAGEIAVVGNLLLGGPRNGIYISDVHFDSTGNVEIGHNGIYGWPSPEWPKAEVTGEISSGPVTRTLLDYDEMMGGVGTAESFIENLREGKAGYDAESIRAWMGEVYAAPEPGTSSLMFVAAGTMFLRREHGRRDRRGRRRQVLSD